MVRLIYQLFFTLLVVTKAGDCVAQEQAFVNFESPVSHGVVISSEGDRLFVVNTPANSLVVLSIDEPASPKVCDTPNGLSIPPGEYGRKVKTQRN